MSSWQKGVCPICRVSVQVKNFKRHWSTQHERHEKKRTYEEIFDCLKSSISDQDKALTTVSIDTFFGKKKRRISSDVQEESITTVVQENFIVADNPQITNALYPSLSSSDIYSNEIDKKIHDENVQVLSQILEDIFDKLETETHVTHTDFVIDKNNGLSSLNNPMSDIRISVVIQNEGMNSNDDIEVLKNSIDDSINPITIQNNNVNHNDDIEVLENSIDDIVYPINVQNDNINDSDKQCSSTQRKSSSTCTQINRPSCTKVFLSGVKFITDFELQFVDQQRISLQDNVWLPSGAGGNSKPSRTWFTEERSQWLRAVYSEKKYGVLCIICAQEAKCESRLMKSKGSFISRPYWTLLHQGLEGIRQHEESELHKQCITRYVSKLETECHGTVIEQLHGAKISKREASFDYLRAVARSFIFLLQQEFAFMNLKDLIKLQQLNLSDPIVRWLSIANKKETYWSGESRGDWLISVKKWLWKKQLRELENVTYITIIADETCDITVMEQLCICLRYFNPSTGELVERIISESNIDGADAAHGYAIRFANEGFIHEVGIMQIILGHAKNFLKQTENRTTTFDKFSKCLDSTVVRIKNTLSEIDHDICKQKIKACRDILPLTPQTTHSTRNRTSINNITFDDDIDMEVNLNDFGPKFINSTLRSINERFGNDSRIIMDNILMFIKLNDYNDRDVLDNPLLKLYCSPMSYKHEGTDRKIYERTDEAFLSYRKLENELPQLRLLINSVIRDIGRIQENKTIDDEICLLDITKFISTNAQYLIPEWFKLYQILTTLPIGSNVCERSFSALQRIKTKLRNSLSSTALETAVKFSILKPEVTENDLYDIVKYFCMHPGRAKTRNIKLYINNSDDESGDEQ
ncbi:unnamed protein product [Rotaria sordida]|uniref:HAT C-terminal dimerisation domain-containing protein n=2 Tax=Rotaria sordida TaxID=392033 RepID=A0A815Q910_9BILA|nr:unnamed protein product [Rotaria sordida]